MIKNTNANIYIIDKNILQLHIFLHNFLSFQTKSTIVCTEPTTTTLCCVESKQAIIDWVR